MSKITLAMAAVLLMACGGGLDHTDPSDPSADVGQKSFSAKVFNIANMTILDTRPQATGLMVKRMNLILANSNILDTVEHNEDEILAPLTNGEPKKTCPYLAPQVGNTSITCRYLVDRAVEDTLTESPDMQIEIEQEVKDKWVQELKTDEMDFVKGWVGEAILSGVEVGMVHSLEQIRKTGACDQAPTPQASAFKLGEEQGKALLEAAEPVVMPTIPRTQCLTDAIAAAVLAEARSKVSGFVQDNPICDGYSGDDLSQQVDVAQAEKSRSAGVEEGLRQSHEALRVRLVTSWVCTAPGGGGDGGGGGDPLVVDLDGDGIVLADSRVPFDLAATGEEVLMPALAGKDALMALDADGNGQIESGAELLGNATFCGKLRCVDGIAALVQHDQNNDGLIDAKDTVWRKLRLWRDANNDGKSSPAELTTLPEAGFESIGLKAHMDLSFANARASSLRSITFNRTDGSSGTVYDVWFRLQFDRVPKNPRSTGVVSTLLSRYREIH
jgi:hypothetical protein